MEVTRNDNGSTGSFVAFDSGMEAGTMTYKWDGEDIFIIEHTEVNEAFSGRGVGKKLLMAAVEFARENNKKINPVCSFAKSMFEKIEAIRDVLK
ncbi:MAG: N-acetyltransferase [Saprospiraceae bacterium]|nr:N-acetyltransferase [Candidatus Brachybacter algidus]